MRSLSSTLLAAQKAASGVPLVRIVVKNAIRDLRHFVFSETFSNGDPDDEHGAVADSTYLHRARVRAGNAQYERNAGSGWTTLSSAADAVHVAIAAVSNARVIIVYNRGTGIYYRESTNQGTSFGAETLILTAGATVNALAVAYRNTSGDLAVLWAEGATVRRVRRTGGAFGSAASWTPMTANSVNGLAVAWNGDFQVVVTGTETTTLRPTLWSLVLGDGFSFTTDTWAAFFIQAQAEADESVTFQAPSIAVLESARITFVEKYTGTPNYTRTYWTGIALTASFSPGNWEWLDPVPLDSATNFGYAVTKGLTPEQAIYSRPAQVLAAPAAAQTLDMTADLLEASIEERDGLTQSAEMVFDNSNGQYAGPPSIIQQHRTVDLGLGYGIEYSRPPSQTIVGWEYRRSGGKSQFVLHTRGAGYWLALSRSRTTIVETRKMTQIARSAAARAGLDFLVSGASSRAANFNIEWVVHPHQTQLEVLRALGEIMPDVFLTFSTGTLLITEPTAGDAVDYTYGTDHAIYRSNVSAQPRAAVAEVVAAGALGQSFDFAALNHDKPLQDRRRSPHETSASDANAHAAARLRKAVLGTDLGSLVTPPNCGLEVGDVIAFSDPAVSSNQLKARVASIVTTYRRADRAVFEQRIGLGGV
jgi:hypothetical protein